VSPGVIRVGDETTRGYLLDDFREAFSRFLPSTPFPDCNNVTMLGKAAFPECNNPDTVLHAENELSQRECYIVTPCAEGQGGDNQQITPSSEPESEAKPDVGKL
jgi:hypothetical protein